MTTSLRVGIVGASFGGTVHAPAYLNHPRFTLAALASPTSAARVAEPLGVAAYPDLAAMLAAERLDVVSIASPPFAHRAAILEAFEAGAHVLCEKPFALNLAEAETLAAAARARGRVGAIAHEFRFLPARQAMRQLVVHGHLGALRQIEVTKAGGLLRRESRKARSWWFEREQGGGLAGAWMSHAVDMACWLAGRAPVAAYGFRRTANPERLDDAGAFVSTVDDGAFATLDFGEGLAARVAVDGTSAVENFVCGVHGEARTAIASGTSIFEERMFSVDPDESAELELRASPYRRFAAASPMLPAFMEMLDAFAAAIDGEPGDLATFEDGVRTQRVLETIGYATPSLP